MIDKITRPALPATLSKPHGLPALPGTLSKPCGFKFLIVLMSLRIILFIAGEFVLSLRLEHGIWIREIEL